jgi:hypothetical protein
MTPVGGSHGNSYAAARIHHGAWRRNAKASRGRRAAKFAKTFTRIVIPPRLILVHSFPQTDTHLGIVHRESGMGRGLLVAAFDFSTAHADEFHDWYDLEHIPERMAVAGFG